MGGTRQGSAQARRPARYSFSIWVVCFLILVAPLPGFLRLDGIRQDYGQYVGLVGLIAFVVWVVEVALLMTDHTMTHLAAARAKKEILTHLDSLNSREAHLLVVAVSNAIQTVTWRQDADEVSSLVAKGLLCVVPDGSKVFHKPYTVPRFVWEHIAKAEVLAKLKALDKDNKV